MMRSVAESRRRERSQLSVGSKMRELDTRLDAIVDSLPARSSVAYFDYPLHSNVGDLLIHAGAERLLQRAGHAIVCTASVRRMRAFYSGVSTRTVIVLHGGGNFGDLYPLHQHGRLEVVQRFPENHILLFPQTVYYRDQAAARGDGEVLRAHRRLRLLVRDVRSREYANEVLGREAELAPDTAHALWDESTIASLRAHEPRTGELMFRRRDVESVGDGRGGVDWPELLGRKLYLKYLLVREVMQHLEGRRTVAAPYQVWRSTRDQMINRAARALAAFEAIDCDRLHAFLLACLLGVRARTGDNTYGKIAEYRATWNL
jgi:pyruvyl transferase EpsO